LESKTDEWFSAFFGNGYFTYIGVEIKDFMFNRHEVSKKALIEMLQNRGYKKNAILEELDRQCYASTLRYIADEDTYKSIEIGKKFWIDLLQRIHEQSCMVGGKFQLKDSGVKLDIYRTDFQSLQFKQMITHLGLHQAPVMRWTRQVKKKDFFYCLEQLMDILPFKTYHGTADRSFVLDMIRKANKKKSKKIEWAWMISYIELYLELTPFRKSVLDALFSLSQGPIDWNKSSISKDFLQKKVNIPFENFEKSIEYLEQKGIIREVNGRLTPTGQGYTLVRHGYNPTPLVTFAIIRTSNNTFRLEVCTKSQSIPMQDLLTDFGGYIPPEWNCLVVFSPREKHDIIAILSSLLEGGLV
jgi:hypothetical protein